MEEIQKLIGILENPEVRKDLNQVEEILTKMKKFAKLLQEGNI